MGIITSMILSRCSSLGTVNFSPLLFGMVRNINDGGGIERVEGGGCWSCWEDVGSVLVIVDGEGQHQLSGRLCRRRPQSSGLLRILVSLIYGWWMEKLWHGAFMCLQYFYIYLWVPVNRAKGSTKTHQFVTKIINFSKIYVFCDKFSNNCCVSQTLRVIRERSLKQKNCEL